MKYFNRKDFDRLIDRIGHLNIMTLEDSYDKHEGNIVNIRHDVDDDPKAAYDVAEIEFDMDIQSTYFILDTAPYWPNKVISDTHLTCFDSIKSFGHRLGWHNNFISRCARDGEARAIYDTVEVLRLLRKVAPITGTASHGDPLCHELKFLNYYMFRECPKLPGFENFDRQKWPLKEWGFDYEAYHTGHTHYLSDAGGEWNHEPLSYIEQFEREGGKLQINIHPQWWQL